MDVETPGRRIGRSWQPFLVAAVVTAMVGGLLFLLDRFDRERQLEAARADVAAQLSTLRARLEYRLNAPLLRARGVVAHIVAHGDISERDFHVVAEVLMKDHTNVRNMIVSRGLVIAMTYPVAGNESVVGVDFRSVPVQYASVLKAIEGRISLLQGPVPLIQGGTGLILRTPVFLSDEGGGERFFGMANVVLDVPRTFSAVGLDDPDLPLEVAIRGRDGLGAAGDMIHGNPAVFSASPVETDVELTQGTWRLAAIPRGGWASRGHFGLTRVMVVLALPAMAVVAFGTAALLIRQRRAEADLRRNTVELQALNAELRRSNADLERFAYLASHDLQTPLRNVASYAQLLHRRYRGRLDADADDFIGFIVENAQRMAQLVQDLLGYARISNTPHEPQDVPAGAALRAALDNLGAAIAEADAEVVVQGTLPVVRVDDAYLVVLFQNLVGNAIKYRAQGRRPRVDISARADGPGVWLFAVADNGIGIAPEYFEQIFGVFQRLHPPGSFEGTGIGLATCQRIVEACGGRLWVESTPGEGATFLFTLPAASDAA
ncbi:ATP-binding protein [Magnetospirillum sp. UT-4]|uniref:sensor histidine kinase n=1 Tax=Magnetospirillum sp. UT-4 TaxID=2681467 RepID=UPI001382FC07|nr:ATP-binding protein [Magnetospirillum sp. UT-4]CAA7625112.1 putative signal transduction histidine kinase [Magnetospirillum sp. UT-4]